MLNFGRVPVVCCFLSSEWQWRLRGHVRHVVGTLGLATHPQGFPTKAGHFWIPWGSPKIGQCRPPGNHELSQYHGAFELGQAWLMSATTANESTTFNEMAIFSGFSHWPWKPARNQPDLILNPWWLAIATLSWIQWHQPLTKFHACFPSTRCYVWFMHLQDGYGPLVNHCEPLMTAVGEQCSPSETIFCRCFTYWQWAFFPPAMLDFQTLIIMNRL